MQIAVGVATGKYMVEALRSTEADYALATLQRAAARRDGSVHLIRRSTMPVKNHIIPDERAQQEVTVAEADRVADPFTLVLFGA